jgi:Rhomboid family
MVSYLRDFLATDYFDWNDQTETLFNLIVLTWCIHAVNWGFCGGGLIQVLGNRPREIAGLPGILCSHFLHGVWQDRDGRAKDHGNSHIVGNTIAFAVMGWFISLQGIKLFYIVTIAVAVASGLGVWLFGRGGLPHVGASGIIYGYCGFLLIYGVTAGNLNAFLMAVLTGLLYHRAIVGILPDDPGTSWEGHMFGFVGGALTAFLISSIQLGVM